MPARIARLVPDARLVYLLRDPVKRLRSHYLERVRAGDETRPPERALREHVGYVRASQYAWQLEQYLEYFPRRQILVITTEELTARAWTPCDRSSRSLMLIRAGTAGGFRRTNTTGEVHLRREWIERLRRNAVLPRRRPDRSGPPSGVCITGRTTKTLTTATLELPAELEDGS